MKRTLTTELSSFRLQDSSLIPIAQAVLSGQRLSREQGLTLMRTPDFFGLGRLACWAKEKRFGKNITYVVSRHINPTNLCVHHCHFCDFAAKPGSPKAFELTTAEILKTLNALIREVHIVSGLHPHWPYSRYLHLIKAIRQACPGIQIKTWTAVEIDWFAKLGKCHVEKILKDMQAAGVDALTGGGAEVFSDRIQQQLYPQKINSDRWCEIHRIAHNLGMPSNATILYGHIENDAERVDHLLRLRQLEDEAPGFLAFIPLSYQKSEHAVITRPTPPKEDLRLIAVSRLLLDNIPHIKAYWVMLGLSTTSMALAFGADDIDGTIGFERIAHSAAANSPRLLAEQTIRTIITDASLVAVERDALHQTYPLRDVA